MTMTINPMYLFLTAGIPLGWILYKVMAKAYRLRKSKKEAKLQTCLPGGWMNVYNNCKSMDGYFRDDYLLNLHKNKFLPQEVLPLEGMNKLINLCEWGKSKVMDILMPCVLQPSEEHPVDIAPPLEEHPANIDPPLPKGCYWIKRAIFAPDRVKLPLQVQFYADLIITQKGVIKNRYGKVGEITGSANEDKS